MRLLAFLNNESDPNGDDAPSPPPGAGLSVLVRPFRSLECSSQSLQDVPMSPPPPAPSSNFLTTPTGFGTVHSLPDQGTTFLYVVLKCYSRRLVCRQESN